MNQMIVRLGAQLVGLAVIFFAIHLGLLFLLDLWSTWELTDFSMWGMYGLEFVISIFIFAGLVGLNHSMPNNLGFAFLGFITLRAVASYLYIKPALDAENPLDFLKYNFVICFMIFLALDAFLAYRILNQNPAQSKSF